MPRLGRSYPIQRIWTPKHKVAATPPTIDAVSAGNTNNNTTTCADGINAAVGADIFVFAGCPGNSSGFSPTGVTFGSTAMTLFGSEYYSGDASLQLWHLPAAGTGAGVTVTATWATPYYGAIGCMSFKNVNSIGTAAVVDGTGTATQSVTLTGSIILQGFSFATSSALTSGGIAQFEVYTTNSPVCSLSFNTATATTTFTGNVSGAYAGIAVNLS